MSWNMYLSKDKLKQGQFLPKQGHRVAGTDCFRAVTAFLGLRKAQGKRGDQTLVGLTQESVDQKKDVRI